MAKKMTTPDRRPTFMDRVREAPTLVKIGVPIMLVLFVIGAVAGGGKSGTADSSPGKDHANSRPVAEQQPTNATKTKEDAEQKAKAAARAEAARAKAAAERSSPQQQITEALGETVSSDVAVGDSEVRLVRVTGQLVNIVLSTPEGGFEGPSTDDTDGLVSAALAKVYGAGDWRGAAYVEFRGGLVNSATGRPLPNAPTVSYRIERAAAKRIDWSDEEALYNIDWSIFRACDTYAIKGCE